MVNSRTRARYNEVTVKVCSRTRACATGAPSFSLECTAGDDYDVFVTASNATATVVFTGKAKCLYVRRELRDLTDEDVSLTMDTMHTLYDTEDQEGMATYGANFLSNSYLTRMHHLNSALQDADHVHEGNGFLAQHIKITNMFEKSMQAVNPAVSLPYWDFTIDSAQGLAIYETFPFTADIFGSIPLPKGLWFSYENESVIEGRIPDGRWANLTADTNALYSSVKQAYGYMRAPWNLNPSPYVSRFSSRTDVAKDLPACLSHYKLLSSTSLMSFSYDIAYAPHAGAHSLSGGTYGCDKFSPLLSAGYLEDEDALYSLCGKWVFFLKEFDRSWNALPNTDGCTAPTEEQLAVDGSFFCGWQCDGGNNTANLEANLFAKLSSYVPEDMSSNSSHEGWVAWREFVCSGDAGMIFSGENLESASPADPSFWIIHPTLERLYQDKMLSGGFEDSDWASDAENDYVCDKQYCYQDDVYGYWQECCDGHFSSSQLIDASGDRCSYFGQTNADTLASTDASQASYASSYVYASFDWGHCLDALGLDFAALSADLVEADATGTNRPTPEPTRKPTRQPTYASDTHSPTLPPHETSAPTHSSAPTTRPSKRPTQSPVALDSICNRRR